MWSSVFSMKSVSISVRGSAPSVYSMNFSARYADSTIHKWIKDANKNGNKTESRGSGNFSSDEAKEIARLRKELKDTQDALEVLKKAIGILGK